MQMIIIIIIANILKRFRGAPLDIHGGHGSLGWAKLGFFTPQPGEFVFFPLPEGFCFFRHRRSLIFVYISMYCLQLSSVGQVGFFTHQLGKVVFFYSSGGCFFFYSSGG